MTIAGGRKRGEAAPEEEKRRGEGVRERSGQRARKRDRGRIQTLIRDSIIELSQGGRFRLHFQLFAGKRSANTVPGALDNVDLSPHLGHRCLLPTYTPVFHDTPTSVSAFRSRTQSHQWYGLTNSEVMIHCRFQDYSSTCAEHEYHIRFLKAEYLFI